jgi:hypothetical protein
MEAEPMRLSIVLFTVAMIGGTSLARAASPQDVIISEIAWAGTISNSGHEWVELYNNTDQAIDLNGWKLCETNASPTDFTCAITFTSAHVLPARGFFLIENNEAATSVPADLVFSGLNLRNDGEQLQLRDDMGNVIDTANVPDPGTPNPGWFAGSSASGVRTTMERNQAVCNVFGDGTVAASWHANDQITRNGTDSGGNPVNGTPRMPNSGWTGVDTVVTVSEVGATPSLADLDTPITVRAKVEVIQNCASVQPDAVEIHVRAAGDTAYTTFPMSAAGDDRYTFVFPAPGSAAVLEFWVSARRGIVTRPEAPPSSPEFVGFYDPANLPCISPVRSVDSAGVITNSGARVLVSGVVTTSNPVFTTRTNDFLMQDDCLPTRAGIAVNNGAGERFPVLAGDRVVVLGTLGQFNGLTQVDPRAVDVLSAGNPVIPSVVRLADLAAGPEAFEGWLVRVRGLSITSGTWPAEGSNANLTVTDDGGTTTFTLFVDRDTDVDGSPAPSGRFSLVGVVFQFDTSSPFTGSYQIVPRTRGDVNHAPVFDPIPDQQVAERQTLRFVVSATDPEGGPLVFSAPSLPPGATFSPLTRTFSFTPGLAQAGSHTATFRVSDGDNEVDLTVNIEVANVGCDSDADCDDGNACTTEACVQGTCERATKVNCCNTAADCDDGNVCTRDACSGPGGFCTHTPIVENAACVATQGVSLGRPPVTFDYTGCASAGGAGWVGALAALLALGRALGRRRRGGATNGVAALLLAFGGVFHAWNAAHAHTITVNGNLDANEWSTRAPQNGSAGNNFNLGMIVRDSAGHGEFIWQDEPGDTRTNLNNPERDTDIRRVQITGTTQALYILVTLDLSAPAGDPVQLQVAMDLDQVDGMGQELFAGAAETKVASAARWEFLLRTSFASGGPPVLFDKDFNSVPTTADGAIGTAGVELRIPWGDLGLTGPPVGPIRFTIATFRSQSDDSTKDIDGSNALDVVTNYGKPNMAGSPTTTTNTLVEVSDQIVNYYFDVWFDTTTGEPYAPLLVTRIHADPPGTETDREFVEIRNQTPITLSTQSYKVGDEETVGQGEGMAVLPGVTLSSGGQLIVALKGTGFGTYFRASTTDPGPRPGVELNATDSTVPDGTKYQPWLMQPSGGSAAFTLSNAGDEVLVLDPSDTVVDVVTYGTATTWGVTPHTAAAEGSALVRKAGFPDTDNAANDFDEVALRPVGAPCMTNGECGTGYCVNNVCARSCNVAADCNDNNACTIDATACPGPGGMCQSIYVGGSCSCTETLHCNDGNACTTDTCSAGTCGNAYAPTVGCCLVDANCNDGNTCTTDTCSSNNCTNAPVVCTAQDQCHEVGTCDPLTGMCSNPAKRDGSPCDDGDLCTQTDTCQDGLCVGMNPVICLGDDCHDAGVCDPETGVCSTPNPRPDGTPCNDGSLCTSPDICQGGVCVGMNPVVCTAQDQCHEVGTCDPLTGMCSNPAKRDGSPCDDGDLCTQTDTCQGGTCVGGNPVVCAAQDQCHLPGVCNPATGQCSNPEKPNDTPCDDGNPCTQTDTCQNGACTGTNPLADGTPCSDGIVCNGSEACQGGACVRTPLNCDDANACTTDSCSEPGGCGHAPIAGCCNTNADCNDNDPCTTDVCSGPGGTCTHTPIPSCCRNDGECNDNNICTTDACSAPGGTCRHTPVANCCVTSADCTPADVCSTVSCDTSTNRCVQTSIPGCCRSNADCDDGNPCTGELCNTGTGECQRAPIPGCCNTAADCNDGNPCTLDRCSGPGGTCSHTLISNCCVSDAQCTDGDACTRDTCNLATNRCVFSPIAGCCNTDADCEDANPCTADTCSGPGGTCAHTQVASCCSVDADCDDGNACTVDTCAGGTCTHTPIENCCSTSADCDDHNVCTRETCSGIGGTCSRTVVTDDPRCVPTQGPPPGAPQTSDLTKTCATAGTGGGAWLAGLLLALVLARARHRRRRSA